MAKRAGALIITSQGVPFLHDGDEFGRTKGGNGNSYKSPDSVNQIDWDRKTEYYDVFVYYKKLIQLRKNHPAFRIASAEKIRKHLNFCTQYKPGMVSYCIDGKAIGDKWEKIILLFNGNLTENKIPLPEGNYQIIANENEIDENGLGEVSDEVLVKGISFLLLKSSQQ